MKLNEKTIKQFIGDLKGIDIEGRTLTALVSTDSVDRDGDVIMPAGWQLDNYRKNPVVLWAHDYYGLPVAKSLAIEQTEHGLMAMMQFADHTLAQDVFDLYAGGFLRAFSVGFIPLEAGPRKDERSSGYQILKAELLEYSCVPVPANQDALLLAMKAAKLCDIKCGCALSMRAAREAKAAIPYSADSAEHYLDLPEQTRSDEDGNDESIISKEAAQPSAELSASIAALKAHTQRMQQGG